MPGRGITVYGQQEVVKDLIAARLAAGGAIHFDVPDVALDGVDGVDAYLTFDGQRLYCDVIAGCDGFHGVSRLYEREYPFAWLGVLVGSPYRVL